jgi:hypothetical protein
MVVSCARKIFGQLLRPLKTSFDNIWLHKGWHAPCELPRMHSSSALAVRLWIRAQIYSVEDNMLIYTLFYLQKEDKHMFSIRILFMYKSTLTDFYNVFGESKLPPEPPK